MTEGWTDQYPHKPDASDEYYFVRRNDRNDVVVMGFSMGKAWLNGVSYEPSDLGSHLFLGPLRPEDVEQLRELRSLVREFLTIDPATDVARWCEVEKQLEQIVGITRKPERDTQS